MNGYAIKAEDLEDRVTLWGFGPSVEDAIKAIGASAMRLQDGQKVWWLFEALAMVGYLWPKCPEDKIASGQHQGWHFRFAKVNGKP